MNKKIKILILGIGQSNFLNQLYGAIRKNDLTDRFDFSINDYSDFSGKDHTNKLPYSNFYSFKTHKFSKYQFKKAFIKFSITKLFWQIFLFELSQGTSWYQIKTTLGRFAKMKHIVENFIRPDEFDIIHFHYCIPENLVPIYFMNDKVKIICSFWGSDLLRTDGCRNNFYVKKALDQANVITVQTMEMAELLYCKFGRVNSAKLKTLRFTLSNEIFDSIDKYRWDDYELNQFREKYEIAKNKIIIALGHNGFSQNNHFLMIQELKKITSIELKDFLFIIHASYGANENYLQLLKEVEGINIKIITDFFGPKEIALLRLSTNLLIQMPTTDALSAAMTEILYAHNSVVVGSWLPYGFFRRKGIFYEELEEFSQLPSFLSHYNSNFKSYNDKNLKNSEIIREHLFPNKTTIHWINLFNDLFKAK